MQDLQSEQDHHVLYITFNRIHKHNAFDQAFLQALQILLHQAEQNDSIRVIVFKANGPHFCAGADLVWMQTMAQRTQAENQADAEILARVMYTLHHSTKATIAMVHGAAFGGGAGIVAACDIALAEPSAHFCFSEVKLGLIPAVISPYVIKAIGERAATWLFMSAETLNAERAQQLQLIQHIIPSDILLSTTQSYAKKLSRMPPDALKASKALVRLISQKTIDQSLQTLTASLIAEKRVSVEGQRGIQAFLNQQTIDWN